MARAVRDQGGISQMFNEDFHTCMFACFLSQEEPKQVHQALKDPSWIEAIQEELIQFKMQKVWILVDLPYEKWAIGTKWVYRNKKDKRGIVIRNKARLVTQGHTQEEGIDYEEVFAPVARIEAIRLFLAYASFMGFLVYQVDVKSAFLYGTIEDEVYVCQPPGFEDPENPDKVYKVVKRDNRPNIVHQETTKGHSIGSNYVNDIIFGATNKALCQSFKKLMKDKFQMSSMGELTFFLGKSASTPIDAEKPLLKDSDGEDVDVHTYRSMIGSLKYLTSSRPDFMFVVCACAQFQVTLKVSHLNAVKRIFRYLKGKPYLGLWYPKDSPFELVTYSDSDYASASLDRKSTTEGCQFLGCRLISWQCKKKIVVATSSTEAEYVAAASGCTQVLWIQNQLLDYGLLFEESGHRNYCFKHLKVFNSPMLPVLRVEMVINSPWMLSKNWLVQKQMTFGVNTPRSDEDRLKLMELMVFLLQKGVYGEIGITAARLSSYCCQENKSDAAEGFSQIIDFLSGSYIHYTLTVNPHIYISCIKQFWNTASVKRLGDVTRLQALVNKKKIMITEAVIHEILQLNDAEGVVCLPTEEIFTGLAQMGYEKPSTKLTFYKAFFSSQWKFLIHTILQSLSSKRTSWNEFSTAMASAVICLSKGQKFNFSKYIFDSLVRNVDSSSKFYMVGKGFSGVETPLYEGMLVVVQPAEEGLVADQVLVDAAAAAVEENVTEDVSHDAIPSPPPHAILSPSQELSLPPQQQQSSPQAPPQDA
nr:hypothetical protein [Tanacetum cinerariifolium]